MDIIYRVSDFGFSATTPEELKKQISDFFSRDGVFADVTIEGDCIRVHINDQEVLSSNNEFDGIVNLLSEGKFEEARPKLEDFVKRNPKHSEGHRCLAQVRMQIDNDIDSAIDTNIEALRCNPRNTYALLLMGNIYAKFKNDFSTGKKYYDKVLEYSPDDFIAINNIGGLSLENNDFENALKCFNKAMAIKQNVNSYYGLSLAYLKMGKYEDAFEIALEGCRNCERDSANPNIIESIRKNLVASAQQIVKSKKYRNVMLGILDAVASETKQKIEIESDDSLKVSAKLEYAPIYHRQYQLIKYNPSKPFMEHLAVHELMHLLMITAASNRNKDRIVYSTSENEIAFRSKHAKWTNKIAEKIGHSKATELTKQLFEGLMLQVMNCPLDMFVEQMIFDKYKVMRPLQLLSLLAQETENQKGFVSGDNAKMFPTDISRASKVMNIVTSMHFEHLYGLRFYQNYKPTKAEFDQAKDLYEEYQAYDDYKPGEEYELIQYFSETLDLESFISMDSYQNFIRNSYQQQEEVDALRDSIIDEESAEGNTFDGLSDEQKKSQESFLENNKDGEDPAKTMMMSMYMLGALQYFDTQTLSTIKAIAAEIAMIGTTGISPDGKYIVHSMKDKEFGGYQLLAYYYVSWKLAFPEALPTLGLPFNSAWDLAKQMFDSKK